MSWKSRILEAVAKAMSAPAQPPPAPPKPRATLAFEVLDFMGRPITTAFATLEGGLSKQANNDGYIAIELDFGTYAVTFDADDFRPTTRKFQLDGNRQFTVQLESTRPMPVPIPPVPTPAPTPVPVPTPAPPIVETRQPQTDEEFRVAWLAILRKHNAPRFVNVQTLIDTRADIEAIGCEWQHTSDGTLRPRLFLPVDFGADPFSRPFDMGLYGETWQWIKR